MPKLSYRLGAWVRENAVAASAVSLVVCVCLVWLGKQVYSSHDSRDTETPAARIGLPPHAGPVKAHDEAVKKQADEGAAGRNLVCKAALKRAGRDGVLSRVDAQFPPLVVAGPYFDALSFDQRQRLASTVNCYLVGGADLFVEFDILDYRTHRVLNHWAFNHLEPGE